MENILRLQCKIGGQNSRVEDPPLAFNRRDGSCVIGCSGPHQSDEESIGVSFAAHWFPRATTAHSCASFMVLFPVDPGLRQKSQRVLTTDLNQFNKGPMPRPKKIFCTVKCDNFYVGVAASGVGLFTRLTLPFIPAR